MSRPRLLNKLDNHIDSNDNPHDKMNWVSVSEDEELGETLPVDADTLAGHPVGYFASKSDVNKAISNYVSTVLGKSY